jgi:eukaryotic-like serine/threonine-protein kinase
VTADDPTPAERDDVRDPADLVGTLFASRYRLTRLVTAGANTVIFDGDEVATGRGVTLKILRPSLDVSPQFVERFNQTIRDVAALSHPNIAAVYDFGPAPFEGATTLFVAVEQLNGGSLRDLFDRGRRLTPSQALVVGLDSCRALDHAHRRGFVHGELNPSKIVFGRDRRLRIVDVGLASLLGEHAWREPATVATHVARYASPEQALSMPIDGKTDVYALCLTLVEAVTGELPFAADSTVATLSARVGRLMPVSADLGPLAAVLSGAGRPDPEDRSTAAEFGRSLLQAAEKLPRPEPLPLLSTGVFEVPPEEMRSPEDPTGGVTRPAAAASAASARPDDLLVVPLDEPDAEQAVEEAQTDVAASGEQEGKAAAPPLAAAAVDEVAGLPAPHPGDDLTILPAGAAVAVGSVEMADDPALPESAEPRSPFTPADVEEPPADSAAPAAAEDGGPGSLQETGRRRRIPWKLIVPVVVLLALGALGIIAWRLFSTPTYEVPDLIGVDETAALEEISGNDWIVSVERERSDAEPDVGQVIRTVPAAGAELAEDEPFLLVVSEGPTLRPLPEVTGLPLADAQTQLVELGLVATVEEQYDEVVPVGNVVSWSAPADPSLVAGADVLPGTEVHLVSSIGPAPRTVPDLTNLTVADAQATLTPLVLGVAEGEHLFSDTVPSGQIITQAPAAGETVPRDTVITVQVSKGPDVVTLPDMTGLTCAQAGEALQAAGFTWTLVFGASDGAFQSATVAGEPASAGGVYRRGTQVDVTCL